MKVKALTCIFFLGMLQLNYAQESFSYVIGTKNYDYGWSLFESAEYYYMAGVSNSENKQYGAFVCRFSNGEDLIEREVSKQDTLCNLFFGTDIENGNILLVGRIDVDGMHYLYTCIMTEGLDIITERYFDVLPDGFDWLGLLDVSEDENEEFVLIGNMEDHLSPMLNGILVIRINQEGNLLDFDSYESVWYDSTPDSDLLRKSDGSGYYYFNAASMNILEFNNALELVDSTNWLGNYPYTLGSGVTAKFLPDGNFAFLDVVTISPYFYDMRTMIFTPDFEHVKDSIFVKEGRQWPATLKGMDYTDPNQIWVLLHNDNPTQTGTEYYEILLLDSQLNISESRVFGGDTDYRFTYLLATNDGGCLVTGSIRQEYGTNLTDIFILKVMPEDITTSLPDFSLPDQKEVVIYPNPFSEHIFTETETTGLLLNLYNLKGELVLQSPMPFHGPGMLNTTSIIPGVFIYSVTDEQGKTIQYGKLIK